MTDFEFLAWPKISRLYREVVVTEKIDGTNAAVIVQENEAGFFEVGAQSRKRVITPDDDNFGFARWVYDHAQELGDTLGVGYHFGEWWGSGIQRGYGLAKGEKRFSLFNVSRWADFEMAWDGCLFKPSRWVSKPELTAVEGLGVVPALWTGNLDTKVASMALNWLKQWGSVASPGFMNPEGVVVFHTAANLCFKATIKGDEAPKGIEGA